MHIGEEMKFDHLHARKPDFSRLSYHAVRAVCANHPPGADHRSIAEARHGGLAGVLDTEHPAAPCNGFRQHQPGTHAMTPRHQPGK
jgi:hypothetical protein